MKIVGKVRIELRDAKTGKLKHISEEHNVVTDSVYNIINGALARAKRGNYNSIVIGSSTEEAIKQLFGGVMVFGRPVDTSHLVPDILEMSSMIGNANQGGTISGSSKKGTLRSATITADSARFIWDFPSTVCNGSVEAICLTSNKGGELGCCFDARDTSKNGESLIEGLGSNLAESVANTIRYDNNTRLFSISGEAANNSCWIIDGDSLVQYNWTTSNSYKRVWSLEDYKNMFKFNEYQANLPALSPISEEVLQDSIQSRFFKGVGDNYALAGDATYVEDAGNITYTLVLSKYTKNSISTINVPMNNLITAIQAVYDRKGISYKTTANDIKTAINNAISNYGVFTVDNRLVWFVGSMNRSEDEFLNIYIQDYDGSFVTLDQIQTDTTFYNLINKAGLPSQGWAGFLHSNQNNNLQVRPVRHNDDNYVYINNYMFYIGVDPDDVWGCYFHNRPFFYAKLIDILNIQEDTLAPKPYFRSLPASISSSTNGDFVSESVLQTNYLATIQNQSNPAIKTPSDIMSITYTLTRTN